jgi:hypothetical protein
MGVKQDRPIDPNEEGVVVYVAKSKEEIDKARAALDEAGVPVNLPEAAIEALFAAGRSSLPIRVAAQDFRKAQDVIDELFPPPVLDLPPLPGTEPPAKSGGGASSGGGSAPAGGGGSGAGGGAALDTYRPEPSAGPATTRKLEASATKVMFIALASFVVPGIGILTGIFASFSAHWCLDQLPYESTSARGRAKAALGLGIAAILVQLGAAAYLAHLKFG